MLKQNCAFTLVELAIVIVIVGLLVGGVLAGQELIRQAHIHSFIKFTEQVKAANSTFQAKYNGVAGDLVHATKFFNAVECNALATSAVGCNSDQGNGGNGLIDGVYASSESDSRRYWVHMHLSNIFKVTASRWGSMTRDDYAYYQMNGIAGRQWLMTMNGSELNSRSYRPGPSAAQQNLQNGNYFFAFAYGFHSGGSFDASMIDATGASSIDSKIDDGKPLSGSFMAGTGHINSTTECISATEYNYANPDISCNLFLKF
jgi:prepilin-type N-terminal cleavage/methylation domain-containing protein